MYFLFQFHYSYPKLKHYNIFLPGYELHDAMQLHETYDGKPNEDGCCHEYLITKIELVSRLCCKLTEQINMVNNEMYDMHIPSDVLRGWKIMQAVHGICRKLAKRYTEYPVHLATQGEYDSLECEWKIKAMLGNIKYSTLNNPRDNITAASLDLMTTHGKMWTIY